MTNDETLGGLKAICENLLIKDSSVRILVLGDANREHVACTKSLGKFLKEHILPAQLHGSKRGGK